MRDQKRTLLIGVIIALASQLYWNVFVTGFRISLSIILLPILLMTLGKNISTFRTCAVTAAIVYLFRLALELWRYGAVPGIALSLLPNAVFYLSYGFLFETMVPNKHTVSYRRLFPALFVCDLLSNILELCLFMALSSGALVLAQIGYLGIIALFRALLSGLFLVAERQYQTLLKKEEHENRYRRLFLMTTGLKNEIYFMKKNAEEIEAIMANSYRLYERLSDADVPEELKHMSLAIARDVHEIKKDYIRIIQGIEAEIAEEYDEKNMGVQDLLQILEASTHHILQNKNLSITLDFSCGDNFITQEHYELMAILKNLVNNAIEAIEADGGKGMIAIREYRDGADYVFQVSDNGPGISPRHLPNIFKMGYSTKFDYKTGNIFRGVGLYGVKATVEEKFGGTISVKSTVGMGTIFTIRIPAASLKEE